MGAREHRSPESSIDLPRVTQQVSGKAGAITQVF